MTRDDPLAVAIINPFTGRRAAGAIVSTLRRRLGRSYRLAIRVTKHPGHAEQLARVASRLATLVIAVGGDGTVAEVATGIVGSRARLAIVPTGTANVIARGLEIPLDPGRAAQVIAGPHDLRVLDALSAGDRIALHMIGCGFDALMVEAAPRALKRAAAWFAYVPAALRNVTEGPWAFRLTVDEQRAEIEAKMVLVANGSFVLQPRFALAPGIRTDDGALDVLVFSPPNLVAATALASRLALGQLEGSPHVQHFRGHRARIESDPPAPVEYDGNPRGTTPIDIEVLPAAIPIIVPPGEPGSAGSGGGRRPALPFSRG